MGLLLLLNRRADDAGGNGQETPQGGAALASPGGLDAGVAGLKSIDRSDPAGVRVLRFEPFDAPAAALKHRPGKKGAVLRFAEARDVRVSPRRDGIWGPGAEPGTSEWRLRIEAPGALNLNLGFGRYHLPESAVLEMDDVESGTLLVRSFSARDNDAHGELWTPVVAGESLDLVLTVADRERSLVDLMLARVSLGFRPVAFAAGRQKIGGDDPLGDCHVDVVCSAAQSGVGTAIDFYRDQIRSVGAFTLEGVDTCSGFMVNNTAADRTPYVMTADHCGVRSYNAASMVVYWNFQNSFCRTPGSAANGLAGDGPLSQFNSGALFRATWAPSDFTLVELDDPVDAAVDVHYAGWSRVNAVPTMGVSVHHPFVTEKRISFDFDSLQSTAAYSETTSSFGTHHRIIDWDHGSTEPGSSGSPLFDQDGRAVGQLTGGDAACGNNWSDWYGKMNRNWTGGGTTSSSLENWLDPLGTGALTVDGVDGLAAYATMASVSVDETDSGTTNLQFVVELSDAVSEVVTLGYTMQGGTATAGSDFVASSGTVSFNPGELSKQIDVLVNGDTVPEEHEDMTIELSVVGAQVVALADRSAVGTIRNDDFITPVIVGPSSGVVSAQEALVVSMEALNTPTSYSLTGAPAGMQINDEGVLTWVPDTGGVYQFSVVATNPAGSATAPFEVVVNGNLSITALDIELLDMTYDSGGNAEWASESTAGLPPMTSLGGEDRLMSGTINHGQSSWFDLSVEGPDYVGFWWKVSSQPGFDVLKFEVDGDERFRISGEQDWTYVIMPVGPGTHVLRWTYSKNVSATGGMDAGWVDYVQLGSRSKPFLMEPPVLHVAKDSLLDWQVPTLSMATGFGGEGLPAGLTLGSDGVILGNATVVESTDFKMTLSEAGTTVTVPATIVVHEVVDIGDALDQPNRTWFKEGVGNWIHQEGTTHDGVDAAWEVGVPDSGRGGFSTVMHGPGEVTFWWMVSSELYGDFLRFELDGHLKANISGEVGWTSETWSLGYGPHLLTWAYAKNAANRVGSDTGRVDQVTFTGYSGWISSYPVGSRTNGIFDRDEDGLSQFMEYAIGGNPLGPEPVPAAVLSGGALQLTVSKPAGVADSYYAAEVSGNLIDWTNDETSVLQDDAATFQARDDLGTGTEVRRFMRFQAGPTR